MIDAKQEILQSLRNLCDSNDVLKEMDFIHIEEIVYHLSEFQFNRSDSKTKNLIDSKINKIASELVRLETLSGD